MKSQVAALLTTVALAVAAAPSLEAARWAQTSLFGGSMLGLAQAPSEPQTLYAVARPGRVYRSLDGGATWQRRGALAADPDVSDLAVAGEDPSTVYLHSYYQGLLRTRDAGGSWSSIAPDGSGVIGFALDAAHPGVLYAAARSGLYHSRDGGDTWSAAGFAGQAVGSVAIDPLGRLLVAILGTEAGDPVSLWTNAGASADWIELARLPIPGGRSFGYPRFVFDPSRPGTVYVRFLDPYDFESIDVPARSTDGGVSWSALPAAARLLDLTAAPDGTLYGGTYFGVTRSDDRGETWSPPLPAAPGEARLRDKVSRVLVSSASPDALLAAGTAGVWASADGSASWEVSSRGIVETGVSGFAVAPTGPSFVTALAGTGFYGSTDQGLHWERMPSSFDGAEPILLEPVDPRRPRTLYGIGTDGQADFATVSTDRGRDWSVLPVPYRCGGDSVCSVTMTALAADPRHPGTLLVAGSYFYHFGGSGHFLLRSGDGFATWTNLNPLPDIRTLVVDPARSSTLYGLTCAYLFKSEDAGARWKKAGNGLPRDLCPVEVQAGPNLVIDPSDPRRLYVGTTTQGVFASTDGGVTFRAMNRGLASAYVAMILIDPNDPARLYAGASGKGVFQWNAERKRWTPLNQGLPLAHFAGALALDARASVLYAGTVDQGAFRLELEE